MPVTAAAPPRMKVFWPSVPWSPVALTVYVPAGLPGVALYGVCRAPSGVALWGWPLNFLPSGKSISKVTVRASPGSHARHFT